MVSITKERGRDSEPAGRISKPAGRASKSAWWASEPAVRGLISNGRG